MPLEARKRDVLDELYTNIRDPAGFGGIRPLYEAAKKYRVTLREVKQYLSSQLSYTLQNF